MLALRIGLVVVLVLMVAVDPSESWGRFRLRRITRTVRRISDTIIRILRRARTTTCGIAPCPQRLQNNEECDSINKAMIKREEWKALTRLDQSKSVTRLTHVVSLWHTGADTCNPIGLSPSNCQQCIQDPSCVKHLILAIQTEDIGNGNDDIRYHFLIGQDGVVYEGRGWGAAGEISEDLKIPAISVAMIGNFDKVEPSQASQNALDGLIQCGQSSGYLAADPDMMTSPEMSGKALDEMMRRLEEEHKYMVSSEAFR